MKIHTKIKFIIAVSILTLSSYSFAGGSSGTQKINKIKVFESGEVVVSALNKWDNPDGCGDGAATISGIALLPLNNDFYSEMYAILVSSYLQGKSVSTRLLNCYDLGPNNYPVIVNISVSDL